MKQFLYLDTDIVNSIIAQSEKGLVQSQTMEDTYSSTKSNQLQSEVNGKGTVGGSLVKLAKLEANLTGKIQGETGRSTTTTSHDIVNKTLHDAAFDIACENIKVIPTKYGDMNNDETGNYLEITRTFDFVDFDYLERIFSKNGVMDFLKKNKEQCLRAEGEHLKQQGNREERRVKGNEIDKGIKKKIQESTEEYDNIVTLIGVAKSIFPYTRMLISYDGYLIPLSEKYFRVDPTDLGFKYGGEITCVGMVTNLIGEDTDPNDEKNIFATLQFTINEALRRILPTAEKNLCVIHPIAIYYGS